ncbi:rRNA maturation RNase YbeY [Acidihalobacter ferrooxydans]|uniref:Endoribonuclease YbeY n=1 Tax=Acidihalobacter ferrooxydans TaxID=1765967 RepID=A0A1P8UER8_9GAMM|nr:rRNA maturation RNase YbeY [Acidihalobacter ferrooxydans]APZ42306.1 rRNA maturation RNase YbeY [Acidihalobacter ferrooxydans]
MIEVQRETAAWTPDDALLARWTSAVVVDPAQEVVLRFVDARESQALNRDYRGKDSPTNVLSFTFESPPGMALPLLGDLVICAEVVEREAREQRKTCEAHFAHIVIHGLLHLQGHDHEAETDAQRMEALEIEILRRLGYDNPYA